MIEQEEQYKGGFDEKSVEKTTNKYEKSIELVKRNMSLLTMEFLLSKDIEESNKKEINDELEKVVFDLISIWEIRDKF